MAKAVKGIAKASENPNIAMVPSRMDPPLRVFINAVPTIGKVQEKLTSTKVMAMKKIPIKPPRSACLSILLTSPDGSVISSNPKKESAKID